MQRALQASPVSSQKSTPSKEGAVMEVSPEAMSVSQEESKNPSATGMTEENILAQEFDNMALNS